MKRVLKQLPFRCCREEGARYALKCIWVLFMALFALSSLVSPDLFVLCSGGEETARIEPFHIAESACAAEPFHCCDGPGDRVAEFHHRHVRCRDVGLSGHLGLIKDRERLPEILCLRASRAPVAAGDPGDAGGHVAIDGEVRVLDVANSPPGIDLQSVVLLI